jgi:hypothetical protein
MGYFSGVKRDLFWFWMLSLLAAGLAGCATGPVQPTPAASPTKPAEPSNISFSEVVASVPVEGAHQVYQNLHVELTALPRPLKEGSQDTQMIESAVRRLEPRISSAVLQLITEGTTLSPHRLGQLREAVATAAQGLADDERSRWSHGSDFEVKMVVVSMYFTDATVGRIRR